MAKMCQKSPTSASFCNFKASYRLSSDKMTSYSCRAGPKLRFALKHRTSIKVRNEENVKQTTNAHISKTRQDIEISSTYLESAANFTSGRCGFVIL